MKINILFWLFSISGVALGHGTDKHPQAESMGMPEGEVTYLGNTGLLVDYLDLQVLFDPFFHNHYNHYQLVPTETRKSIFDQQAPFDSVEMILVSHAHGDHFDAKDVVDYLKLNPLAKLVAPSQAIEQLKPIAGFVSIESQTHGVGLAYGDDPIELSFDDIKVEAIRIPHAGWPGRADVSNLVYRVTLNDAVTVMHMGDADPDDAHFKPWVTYWKQQITDHAFPPYWFFGTAEGMGILTERINATHHTGVHVPVVVPEQLKYSGKDYFTKSGKVILIKPNKKPNSKK